MTKCAFEPCLCAVIENEKYCSDFCEAFDVGTIALTPAAGVLRTPPRDFKCGCGHPGCTAEGAGTGSPGEGK